MINHINYLVDITTFIIAILFVCVAAGSLLEFIKVRQNPSPKPVNHDKRFKKIPNRLTQHLCEIEEA